MKILVHHDGALGDVVLSLPSLLSLRTEGGDLHFMGRPDIGRMLRDCGVVEEASDSGAGRYSSLYDGRAQGELTSFFGRFDRATVFTVDADGPAASAFRESLPDARIVRTMPPSGVRVSAARFRLDQVSPGTPMPGSGLLPVPMPLQDLALAMLSRWGWKGDCPLVMVHPGSGGKTKRWPLERFLSVAWKIRDRGAFVVFFSGPAEEDDILDQLERFSRSADGFVHVSDADLTALAALLGQCGAYVGNDSGVSHLAAAVGAPTVALFGPTDPGVWGPVGDSVHVIAADRLERIGVEQVTETLLEIVESGADAEGPRAE